ncbi:MAG: hypothetical protein ACLRSD_17505 [Oscillibacter sp.]
MSGSSTLVTLRAPDGKQIPAFARGARPELSAGTVLSNVKITMRQQDTVAFYVLEILRDRPTGGQGGVNSDSAKNGRAIL